MAEKVYLAYFEAVTTNAPGCAEQRKHSPANRGFAQQENDFYELDDSALKTALLGCDEPRLCVFLGTFDEEQIDTLERSLADKIDFFSFPHEWCRVNFNRKHIRTISEKTETLPKSGYSIDSTSRFR